MGTPVTIKEVIWPCLACIKVTFPDEENREKFLFLDFEFFVNGRLFSKGWVQDFWQDDMFPTFEKEVDGTIVYRAFLNIIDPPGLKNKHREVISLSDRLPCPTSKDSCELVVIDGEDRVRLATSPLEKDLM